MKSAILLMLGSVLGALYAAIAILPEMLPTTAMPQRVVLFLGLAAAAFAVWLAVLFVIKPATSGAREISRDLKIVFVFAVLFRAALLPATPWLSNDVQRYLWDAHLLQHGVNPYRYPPEAPELDAFKSEEFYTALSHKHVPTVYPPVLQGLFVAGKSMSTFLDWGAVRGLKLLFTVFDLLLIAALFKILPRLQIDPRWAILYAWHPLPIIEIAGSGHADVVGVLFVVLALAALHATRWRLSAVWLALAFLVKFISILLLPFLILTKRGRRPVLQALGLFCLIIAASYLPFLSTGKNIIAGLLIYSAKWRFNDGIFSLCYTPLHALLPDALVAFLMVPRGWEITSTVLATRRVDLALLIVKTIMAAMFSCLYVALWLQMRRLAQQGRALPWAQVALLLFAGFFLLTPTLQPWYLLWILPLLCLTVPAMPSAVAEVATSPMEKGRRGNSLARYAAAIFSPASLTALWWSLVVLSGTILGSYWILRDYLLTGVWQEQAWVKWLEFGLPLMVGVLVLRAGKNKKALPVFRQGL